MTKAEKAKIRRVISLLMGDEERFDEAMVILCRLADLHYPAGEITIESVDIVELMRRDREAGG